MSPVGLFFQQVLNGVALGSGYAIFAMGFGILFANMNILSIGHGTLATFGGLITLWGLTTVGLPLWPAVAVAVVVCGLLGVAIDQIGFQPLRNRGQAGFFGVLLVGVGIWIVLLDVLIILSDGDILSFPPDSFPREFHQFGAYSVSTMQLILIGVALALAIGLYKLIHGTRFGTGVRAVGYSETSSALSGVNARTIIVATSFLVGATCGLAGVLLSINNNQISVLLGDQIVLRAFAAVVIGGFGDVRGAYLGGLFVGLSEVLAGQYVSNSLREAVAFGALFLFLMYRPRGILGTQEMALKI